jgi:carbamoyltransferase
MEIKGRDLMEGVPKSVSVSDEEIREALDECINIIINSIRVVLERTPPELSADIVDRVPVHGGMINGNTKIGFDSRKRVVIAYSAPLADKRSRTPSFTIWSRIGRLEAAPRRKSSNRASRRTVTASLAGTVSVGLNGKIKRLHGIEFPHSLGQFYETVTSGLGFKPSRHEGKIVGLAAYGDPAVLRDVLLARFDVEPGNFRIKESNNHFFARMLAAQFPKIDVAAAYQHVLERVAADYVAHYLRQTGLHHLVLSGGVVANVKLNQRLRELHGVHGIFIHPNMGDGGCGTGAALLEFEGRPELATPINDVYLGPSFSSEQITDALRRAQLPFTSYKPIEPKIATLLAAGKVIARFDGRMEFGPRALGNRSILADPRRRDMKDTLNKRIKFREHFRPFCPSITVEDTGKFFEVDQPSPFMVQAYRIRPEVRDLIPAVVHEDGTGRLQTVEEDVNPRYWKLLKEFESLTGVPVLINTSFNENEPIVNNPQQAVDCFLRTDMDVLAIGPFLLRKSDNPPRSQGRRAFAERQATR